MTVIRPANCLVMIQNVVTVVSWKSLKRSSFCILSVSSPFDTVNVKFLY